MQNTTFCKHCATVRHVGENTMMEDVRQAAPFPDCYVIVAVILLRWRMTCGQVSH